MDKMLIVSIVLNGIATLMLAVGARGLHKAGAAEMAVLRDDLRTLQGQKADMAIACISSIRVAPGDSLVLTTERWLDDGQVATIRAQVEQTLAGVRVTVLSGNLRALGVLTLGDRT